MPCEIASSIVSFWPESLQMHDQYKNYTQASWELGRAFTLYTLIISLLFRVFFFRLRPSVKMVDNSRLNKLFLQKRGHFFSISIIQLATISNYRASFPQFIIRINTALKFIQKKDVLIYILFLLFSICLFACFFFQLSGDIMNIFFCVIYQ